MKTIYIYGKHSVDEALTKKPESVKVLYAKENIWSNLAFAAKVERVKHLEVKDFSFLPKGVVDKEAVHQGVVAEIDTEKLTIPFKEYQESLGDKIPDGLVMLGEVQDPHNVGAIIRSASAFGAGAVLIPEHRQAQITASVVKVSAGGVFNLPLVSVGNVNAVLRSLKKQGYWVYGLDSVGDTELPKEDFPRPSVFVLGNEGVGLREKTRETCDSVISIPIHPRSESLNASVAGAVVLYDWSIKKQVLPPKL